jgi:hypothetical protein
MPQFKIQKLSLALSSPDLDIFNSRKPQLVSKIDHNILTLSKPEEKLNLTKSLLELPKIDSNGTKREMKTELRLMLPKTTLKL